MPEEVKINVAASLQGGPLGPLPPGIHADSRPVPCDQEIQREWQCVTSKAGS